VDFLFLDKGERYREWANDTLTDQPEIVLETKLQSTIGARS
jgi:hypothetical protein